METQPSRRMGEALGLGKVGLSGLLWPWQERSILRWLPLLLFLLSVEAASFPFFLPLIFIAAVLHVRSTLREFPTQLVLLPLFLGRQEAQGVLSYGTVEQGIQWLDLASWEIFILQCLGPAKTLSASSPVTSSALSLLQALLFSWDLTFCFVSSLGLQPSHPACWRGYASPGLYLAAALSPQFF